MVCFAQSRYVLTDADDNWLRCIAKYHANQTIEGTDIPVTFEALQRLREFPGVVTMERTWQGQAFVNAMPAVVVHAQGTEKEESTIDGPVEFAFKALQGLVKERGDMDGEEVLMMCEFKQALTLDEAAALFSRVPSMVPAPARALFDPETGSGVVSVGSSYSVVSFDRTGAQDGSVPTLDLEDGLRNGSSWRPPSLVRAFDAWKARGSRWDDPMFPEDGILLVEAPTGPGAEAVLNKITTNESIIAEARNNNATEGSVDE